MLIRFFILTFALLTFNASQAAIVFSPTLSYYSKTETESAVTTERKVTDVSMRLGYLFDMGLYTGVTYSLADEEFGTGSSDYNLSAGIGYMKWNAYIILSYIFDGQKDLSSAGVKYSEGSGHQIDLGYLVPVTETFKLGPQISMKRVGYGKRELQGAATGTDRVDSYVTPYLALWFQF